MKSKILLFVAIAVCSGQLNAQEKWFVSPGAGVNLVPLTQNEFSDARLKSGPSISLLTGSKLGKKCSIEFGPSINSRYVTYSYQTTESALGILDDLLGSVLGNLSPVSYVENEVLANYWTVDFPVLFNFKLKSGPLFFAGAYGNYNLAVNNHVVTTTRIPLFDLFDLEALGIPSSLRSFLPESGTEKSSNSDRTTLNEFNFGAIAGVGYTWNKWKVSLSYQYGFNKVVKNDVVIVTNNQQNINLSLAYYIFPALRSSHLKPRYDLELIK